MEEKKLEQPLKQGYEPPKAVFTATTLEERLVPCARDSVVFCGSAFD